VKSVLTISEMRTLVSIYGLFSDPGTIAKHLDQLSGFVPSGALDVAREQLTRVTSKGDQALGLTFVIGLAISFWSSNAAMKSLFDTLNIVYGEKEKRGFVKLNAASLAFTIAAIAFVILALGAVVVVPVVLNYLSVSDFTDLFVRIARWPAMFICLALALACIYRFGRAATCRVGAGSHGAVLPPHYSGSLSRHYSPGTPPISASLTRPTGLWAP
jgi:membrane protein